MNDRFVESREALLHERKLLILSAVVTSRGRVVYIPKTLDTKMKIRKGVDYAKAQ